MDEVKYYILFPSYNHGLALEKYLKKEKIKYIIAPTPRELSACCGMSMIYNIKDEERIKELAKQNSIEITGFYEVKPK